MPARELLILLRHLAGVQQRIDRQLEAQRDEIIRLEKALMHSRAALVLNLTRRAWLESPPPSAAAPDDAIPRTQAAPLALLGGLRRQLRCVDLNTRQSISALAAEVVICQSGCLSHDAYWRVQEYCRRHGKGCLLVEADEVRSLLALTETSSF